MSSGVQGSVTMGAEGSNVEAFTADLEVVLHGAVHSVRWPSDQSLVDVMIEASMAPPHSCLVGKCGACVCTLVDGEVSLEFNEVLDHDDLADNYILGCQARPLTQNVKITFD